VVAQSSGGNAASNSGAAQGQAGPRPSGGNAGMNSGANEADGMGGTTVKRACACLRPERERQRPA